MASVLCAITSLLAVSKVQVTQFVMAKCPMSTSLHLDFARTVMSHKDLRCEIFSNKLSIFFIISLRTLTLMYILSDHADHNIPAR